MQEHQTHYAHFVKDEAFLKPVLKYLNIVMYYFSQQIFLKIYLHI